MKFFNFSSQPFHFNQNLRNDLPAGIAVFFVAVPLCIGIAHASGAPLISGLISGVIGGVMIGFFSNSQLSVSGPAAGLTAIALLGIQNLGSFDAFLLATCIAGLMQIIFGVLRTGAIANYIPNAVIKGMISAIGVILIIKQFPHIIGYDIEEMGVEEFSVNQLDMNEKYIESKDTESNTFSIIFHAINNLNRGVLFIGIVSLLFLFIWDKTLAKKIKTIPSSLLVVLIGILISYVSEHIFFYTHLNAEHFVEIPSISGIKGFVHVTTFPDWGAFSNPKLYITAFTIAIVASVETLLAIEAVDKLDTQLRRTNANRELIAQGIGNTFAGLLGGLPMTSVIVRGSVNVSAGAKSKLSTIIHGLFILIAVLFFAQYMNLIPLASLAAVLVYTGYKLVKPQLIFQLYKKGWEQLLPFLVTVIAVVTTDLLVGVSIGILFSAVFIVKESYKATIMRVIDHGKRKRILLGENITFLHKPKLLKILDEMPENTTVEIDGSHSFYIDKDMLEVIEEFKLKAKQKNIELIIGGIKSMANEELKESMKRTYEKLFVNNNKWVEEKLKQDPEYFKDLAKGQTPQYLFIGCSDSRVPANEITGTHPGEMFVQRNIANLVVNTDVNLMSVVQYSVEVLNVKHVIVCGHYGCGGIKAAMEDTAHGLIDKWLRNIKDVYRIHREELDAIKDPEKHHRRLVELNVREQVYNLMKTSFIQKNRMLYGFPEVHGWVYDIEDGHLNDMKIDVEKEFPEFNTIYKIY